MAVSEAIARPIRTAVQLGAGTIVTEFIDSFHDLSDRQYLATVGLLTLVLSCVQAAVENATGKALLRSVPPKDVPVVDNPQAGYGLIELVVGVLLVLILVVVLLRLV